MNKKSIYVKPMICVVALETSPILAAESIAADSEFETEEANSKGDPLMTVGTTNLTATKNNITIQHNEEDNIYTYSTPVGAEHQRTGDRDI